MPFLRDSQHPAFVWRRPRRFVGARSFALSVAALSAFGCAAGSDEAPTPDGSGGTSSGTTGGSSGTSTGGSSSTTGGSSGTSTGGASGTSGTGGSGGSGGASGSSGSNGTGGSGGSASGVGEAVLTVTSFSLTSCSQSASASELAAQADGLTDPKPTQSYADGVLSVDYTTPGQYAQVGVNFAGADMTGCGISVTVRAESWPGCGVYVVPFFYDMTGGLIAPYDTQRAQFVGEEASNQGGDAIDIAFAPAGATLTAVGRVGLNVYNCAESVIVSDL
jgi:hypothetical protein